MPWQSRATGTHQPGKLDDGTWEAWTEIREPRWELTTHLKLHEALIAPCPLKKNSGGNGREVAQRHHRGEASTAHGVQ